MSAMVLRIDETEYAKEQWVTLDNPVLGDTPFFLFQLNQDKSGTLDNGTEVMNLDATVGGGFTLKNLPLILRAIAAQLEARVAV